MKAWVLQGINDLQLKDVSSPIPKKGEVLVQVKAAGICSSDISRIYTTGAYHYPIILGHEFSGVTQDGRHVAVFPLIPCHKCEPCQHHHYETCSNYSYIGSRQNGAFAEYVAVPEWNLITLPTNVTFEQGALFEPAAVAHHAVTRTKLDCNIKAAIIGDGIIGQLIGAWLKHYGIKFVEVLGRKDITSFVNYNICFEAVGSSESFLRCTELTQQNGEIILVGNPNIDFNIDQKTYWQILRKQLIISGTWNSSYPYDWERVLENLDILQLHKLVSHKYKFSELKTAVNMMYTKDEKHSKVMCGCE